MGRMVLDTEAVTGLERNGVLRTAVQALLREGWDVVIPAVVLAECIRGRARNDAQTHRTLKRIGTILTDEATARYAGVLRARVGARPLPSGIDALVAAHACLSQEPSVVFTSDPKDLAALTQGHPRVRVEKV